MTAEQGKKHQPVTDSILRMPEVLKLTGLSKATIYRMMKDGKFPKNYKLSERAVGWKTSTLCAWTEDRKFAAQELKIMFYRDDDREVT